MIDEADPRLDELAELIGGSPHNLVARGERERVRELHVRECLAVARALTPVAGARWVDIGTGGGLPGLVLALAHPQSRWTLVEATAKKAGAVRAFAAGLGLQNVAVVSGRAEEVAWESQHRSGHDGAVSRAVAALPALVELCRGFVAPGGTVVAVKGPGWEEEVRTAATAMERLGLTLEAVSRLTSAPRPTWLVTMRAVGPPPDGYPRRVGVPQSRPIGRVGP